MPCDLCKKKTEVVFAAVLLAASHIPRPGALNCTLPLCEVAASSQSRELEVLCLCTSCDVVISHDKNMQHPLELSSLPLSRLHTRVLGSQSRQPPLW